MNMQELMRELIMQGMQRLPERQLQAETAEVLRQQQALPGHAAEQAGPAIYTGRAIWRQLPFLKTVALKITAALKYLKFGDYIIQYEC